MPEEDIKELEDYLEDTVNVSEEEDDDVSSNINNNDT